MWRINTQIIKLIPHCLWDIPLDLPKYEMFAKDHGDVTLCFITQNVTLELCYALSGNVSGILNSAFHTLGSPAVIKFM